MKKLVYLIVVVVALGLIVAGCIPVVPPAEQSNTDNLTKGSTINVPADYSTIQEAINAASPDDTIIVAAGTYNENIIIDKSLTVKSVGGPKVTIIHAQPTSFGVLIYGIGTVATFDGFTVENYVRVGILAGSFSLSEEDPLEIHILNNIISEPMSQQNNNCIQVGDGTTGTIIGNEVFGAWLVSPSYSGSGILVAGSSNVMISDNYVHDCEGGIQILGYEYKNAPAGDNLIENNLVEDCKAGISVQGDSIGTIISNNDVLNNDTGIGSLAYDFSYEQSTPSGTEVHYNNIVGNVNYGVKSSVWWHHTGEVLAEEVDATCNWWGHPGGPLRLNPDDEWAGPRTADRVSRNVDYHPWLHKP